MLQSCNIRNNLAVLANQCHHDDLVNQELLGDLVLQDGLLQKVRSDQVDLSFLLVLVCQVCLHPLLLGLPFLLLIRCVQVLLVVLANLECRRILSLRGVQ